MTNTPQYLKPLEAAKAYVALVGTVATALLAVFTADTEVGKVLLVLSVIATAVATYKVPNAEHAVAPDDEDLDEGAFYDGHGA